jgi:serine/threonine protein kinase/thioredoxin-like negative regulator of GroEL
VNDQPKDIGISPGDEIDKYQIIEQIGAGGMSIVWKGHDELLTQTVAIKQALPESIDADDQSLRERVRIEAELQKRVTHDHKHLVAVKDLIEDERGIFIVMEYVEGITLEQHLAAAAGPKGIQDALGIVAAIALALETCHKNGVHHRDLKPSNVLLPKSGGLKVCDFGLAALIGEQGALSVGTVRYMAPELFRGETVDGRADIYSLGMIAYEMLAGRDKFNEAFKNVLRDQRNQALRWMKWHTNPRAAAPSLSQLNPNVPDTLSKLVARMCAKDPTQRVESASQLISAIRRHFAGRQDVPKSVEPKTAAPASTSAEVHEPTASLPKRRRWPYVVAAILVLQLLLAGGYGLWSNHENKARIVQLKKESKAIYDQSLEDYSVRQWSASLDGFHTLVNEWSPASGFAQKSKAYILLIEGRKLFETGEYDKAREKYYRVQDGGQLSRKHHHVQSLIDEASKRLTFDKFVTRIEQAIKEGRYGEARQMVNDQSTFSHTDQEDEALIALSTRISSALNRKQIDMVIASAKAVAESGKREQAIFELEQSQLKYHHADIAMAIDTIRQDGRYSDAMQAAQSGEDSGNLMLAIRSLEKAQQIRATDDKAKLIRSLKGRLAYNQGRDKEQDGAGDAAITFYTAAAGFGHPQARQAMARIESSNQVAIFVRAGDTAMAGGDFEAAMEHYQSALSMDSSSQVRSQLTNAKVRHEVSIGKQLLSQGNIADARKSFARAMQLAPDNSEAKKGLARISLQANYMQLIATGDSLRSQGKLGEAKDRYRQARVLIKTEEVQQRLNDTEYEHLIEKAKFYMRKQDWRTAAAWLQSARKLRNTEQVQKLIIEVKQHTR